MNSKLHFVSLWSGSGRRLRLPEAGSVPERWRGGGLSRRLVSAKALHWEEIRIMRKGSDQGNEERRH
jgi:hypothetical protein